MWKWIKAGVSTLFGKDSEGKGIVEEVSDVVDKWHPSATTKHKMSIEDLQAGDSSQESARRMEQPRTDHDNVWISAFNAIIDGINRLPRPGITLWVFGVLVGWWDIPPILLSASVPPMFWNIAWTVITFWFGSRVIFKDIPAIWKYLKK